MDTPRKNVDTPKGVRRITGSARSLTGEVNGQEFESALERDLLMLVHWDHEVDWYQSQPVKIEFKDPDGKKRSYTPDLLVKFKSVKKADKTTSQRKPLLCEVKYRKEYAKKWKELKPKFRAARAYCKKNGYDFAVMTDREIRTEFLKSVQFLWSYRFATFYPDHNDKLKEVLSEMGETDVFTLVNTCYSDKIQRGEAQWTLWCMIARGQVHCDLRLPLTPKSRIWI
jgi:hypothetical protein